MSATRLTHPSQRGRIEAGIYEVDLNGRISGIVYQLEIGLIENRL